MEIKCKQCGVTYESAHTTYDGYKIPYITKRCVKERRKCEDESCMICNLDGGHIVEYYGTGRHRWKGSDK